MIHFEISIPWTSESKIKQMTKEQRDNLRANIFAFKSLHEPTEAFPYLDLNPKYIIDEVELEFLQKMDIPVEVKNFKNTYPHKNEQFNKTGYHFHIPNLGLLEIRFVTVLEDCCTNLLQEHLDKGWKIIAICPPNGQRRPDYIMGSNSKIV